MPLATFTIKSFGPQTGKGRTAPFTGTLDAILKRDGEESPYAVYNEYVALRLGQMLSLPLMAGVPVAGPTGLLFASLRLNETGMSLPDMHQRRIKNVVDRYSQECAAILVFDCWIGNDDRAMNIKAYTSSAPVSLFRAYDHDAALLGPLTPPGYRLKELADGGLIVGGHPFSGKLAKALTDPLVKRIQKLTQRQIAECCCLGAPLHGASAELQEQLTQALIDRQPHLPRLLSALTTP